MPILALLPSPAELIIASESIFRYTLFFIPVSVLFSLITVFPEKCNLAVMFSIPTAPPLEAILFFIVTPLNVHAPSDTNTAEPLIALFSSFSLPIVPPDKVAVPAD